MWCVDEASNSGEEDFVVSHFGKWVDSDCIYAFKPACDLSDNPYNHSSNTSNRYSNSKFYIDKPTKIPNSNPTTTPSISPTTQVPTASPSQ